MMPSPLREIDPDQPKRLHTFGNPFKQDKKVPIAKKLQVKTEVSYILSCFVFTLPPLPTTGNDDR